MLRKASALSVCKINMDTDIRLCMTAGVRESITENPKNIDPRKYLGNGRDLIFTLVDKKINEVLGSKDSMNK